MMIKSLSLKQSLAVLLGNVAGNSRVAVTCSVVFMSWSWSQGVSTLVLPSVGLGTWLLVGADVNPCSIVFILVLMLD